MVELHPLLLHHSQAACFVCIFLPLCPIYIGQWRQPESNRKREGWDGVGLGNKCRALALWALDPLVGGKLRTVCTTLKWVAVSDFGAISQISVVVFCIVFLPDGAISKLYSHKAWQVGSMSVKIARNAPKNIAPESFLYYLITSSDSQHGKCVFRDPSQGNFPGCKNRCKTFHGAEACVCAWMSNISCNQLF